jgi:hypothetical protein
MVKLPVIGSVKTVYVWAAGAIVVVVVGVAYARRRSAGSSSADGTTAATDAAAAIDPETGLPEGSAEDLSALQEMSGGLGGVNDIGDTGAGGAGTLYYDPADGLYDLTSPYNPSQSGTSNTGPGTFTDNAYWTQYAIENVQGYSAAQIQGALAAYLAGQGLTTTQMSIYQAALAVAGSPPKPPATGAHLATGGGGTGGTTGKPAHAPGSLHSAPDADGATVSWGKLDKATGYELVAWEAIKGTPVIYQGQVTGTTYTFRGLKPGSSYGWHVAGENSAGQGPASGNQHFSIKAVHSTGPVRK